jgi:copper chaperone CopZ
MRGTLLRASWIVIGVMIWGQAMVDAAASQEGTPAGAAGELITLKIEGWTCSSCEKDIRHALEAVPGVKQVVVSYARGGAEVEVDPEVVRPERLVEAVGHSRNVLSAYRATVVPNGSLMAESGSGGGIGEWFRKLLH